MKINVLTDHVIHGTEFWTPTNIADGLNALAICIEVLDPQPFAVIPFRLMVQYR